MLPCLTLLALLAPISPMPRGQEAPAVQQDSVAEPRARTTVLHLAGGVVLRTRAREVDGGWEVQVGREWHRLEAVNVLRARPERELLDQAAKLERGVPRDDLVRRVAYADWLATEGLFAEAVKQVDRVLAKDPDQRDALALIARAHIPLDVPAAPRDEAGLEPFFAAAARLSTVGREMAVLGLAGAEEIPGLRPALARELVSKSPGRRELATLALRRMFPGSEAEGLLSRAVLDSSRDVRAGAALALKAFADPAVIVPAVRAIGSKHAEVRTNAIEALGAMEYREAVEPLYEHLLALQSGGGSVGAPRTHIYVGKQTAYVQDYDVEVAQFAAVADPIINVLIEGNVLDVAVIGVNEYQVATERAAVRRALAQLTGANPGDTTVAWQRWWQEHGDDWKAGAAPPKAPTSPAGQG